MANDEAITAAMRASPEFHLIGSIARTLGARAQGLGDDAAVFPLPHGDDCVVSVDASVEGVHFRREWLTPREIGYRAAAAAMSDLAAMAAVPRAILLALALPDRWRADVPALAEGVGELAAMVGAPVAGGNVSAASELSLTITVIGSARTPLRRTGVEPGDALYVTGHLGGPSAALAAFLAGEAPGDAARSRFARPQPRLLEARWLAASGAVAAIDISDGLLADAEHLAAASGVAIDIDPGLVPCVAGIPPAIAASGGEEYELLVAARTPVDTAAFAHRFGIPLTRIGTASAGEPVVRAAGLASVAKASGHDHFTR